MLCEFFKTSCYDISDTDSMPDNSAREVNVLFENKCMASNYNTNVTFIKSGRNCR